MSGTKAINKIVKKFASEGTVRIKEEILKENPDPETLIPDLNRIKPYFTAPEITKIFEDTFNKDPVNILKYAAQAKDYIQNDKLREKIIEQYKKTPWQFYIHAPEFATLFPKLYFDKIFKEQPDILNDSLNKIVDTILSKELKKPFREESLFNIFLAYNAGNALSSYSPELRALFEKEKGVNKKISDIIVGDPKEAGFSCGGLEDNYRAAIIDMSGLCIVNNVLLAKLYHRKAEAKKVSFITLEAGISENDYPLWKNMIYAPSNGQHEHIIDGISNKNMKSMYIPDLIIKPVRPLIGTTSEEIYRAYTESLKT